VLGDRAALDRLLDQLAASPADRDAGLRVYADQLIEAGEPLGELIVVALERQGRESPELARREDELIAQLERGLDERLTRALRPSYRWRTGFLDAIELDHAGDEPFAILPGLAAEPCARLLRRIQISALEMDGQGDLAPVIAELARLAPRFPRLVELVVLEGADLGNPWIDGPITIGDITPLYAAYPELEVLVLHGDEIVLGDAIELEALRELALRGITMTDVRRIVAARLPKLAHLELEIGPRGLASNVAAGLGPLLHRDFGPQLEHVSLYVPPVAQPWLLAELPGCPLLRHARSLALPGRLEDGCYHQLIECAPRLDVERLELWQRPIPVTAHTRLARVYGRRLALV
jgi:hypothetical protein